MPPLAEATGVGMAVQGDQQLIAPRPRAAGHVVLSVDEDLGEGSGQAVRILKCGKEFVGRLGGLALEEHDTFLCLY